MSHRLFVGLALPEAVRDGLFDAMDDIENARWQSDEQLHLTLRYIGEVDTPLANDVADALSNVRQPPFSMQIAGVGHFARKGRATAVWADLVPSPVLCELQRKVERACQSAGLAPETRRFVPHVTLARLNAGSGAIGEFLAAQSRLRLPVFPVGAFTLFESHLSHAGSHYEPVLRFALR